MTIIYYLYHSQRKSERVFFEHIRSLFPNSTHVNRNFSLPPNEFRKPVIKAKLLNWLENDKFLTENKRAKAIKEIRDLPAKEFYISKASSSTSFDIVIERNEKFHFIEYHEKQHRDLSSNRSKIIFNEKYDQLSISRGHQRLIKDVWRVLYFKPYIIVWDDWFLENSKNFKIPTNSFNEFSLPNKFSFKEFCQLQ